MMAVSQAMFLITFGIVLLSVCLGQVAVWLVRRAAARRLQRLLEVAQKQFDKGDKKAADVFKWQ